MQAYAKFKGTLCHISQATKLGDIITADHKVLSEDGKMAEQSKVCNCGAGKNWPPSRYKVHHAEQELRKKRRDSYRSVSILMKIQRSFSLTTLWNPGMLAKSATGTIVRLHLVGLKRLELQKEQSKE